jgi:hypothetical protein
MGQSTYTSSSSWIVDGQLWINTSNAVTLGRQYVPLMYGIH